MLVRWRDSLLFPFPKPYWDGYTSSKALRPELTAVRHSLFGAAERHDWLSVFKMLAEDKESKLVNVCCPNVSTGYTLLHHAVASDAPAEVIEKLIEAGAFRSVCCQNHERPIDIAKRLGFDDLLDLLSPERKHDLSQQDLDSLQTSFRELILEEGMSPVREMRLPQLGALLEQDEPTMTFQAPFGVFVYRLFKLPFPIAIDFVQEDFVLLVRSYQRMGEGRERHFVITPHGRQLVSVKDFG